ncbi:flagellar filament capping protein FliD [Sphingomonas sp. AP4-R1]|uniref:flagellar filament capping protein FliD n=1 Tax=Sphingomonas sp. AP4-R1 TaxID=2735134 RepID=UPI0014935A13|nr:flagellar filament capping protein FliD [Sphingomonas sp. AP4-R1]QJU57325.1 flagellar filament capping protein FliD [Sphingomonas sp. AP4-R1]
MTTTSATAASSGSAILTALNANNGIDTGSLVTGLVSATYDTKTAAVTAKETANTAKISSLATLSNGIDAFSTALTTLISGGSLFTQPTSSNTSVLTATAKAGSQIGALSAQLSVRQVAQAQSLVSPYYANAGAAVGTGTIVIGSGANSYAVTINSGNNTLAGLAQAINSSGAGVTASVVTDSTGARLTLKGATGAANAFTITPGPDASADLAKLAFNASGMTVSGSSVVSPALKDATTAAVGQGNFTLTTAQGSATITIDSASDNLTGMADAINNAGLGVTASIVTDASGSRLAISDSNGGLTAPSFTLQPAANAQVGQVRFVYPQPTSGMTQAQSAQDAIVRLDGVDVSRASNTIDDLIDGVSLNLVSAAPNETITLGASRPTDAIKQAVSDFVAAYNELKGQIDTATATSVTGTDGSVTTGPLYNNSAIRQMQTQLSRLTSTVLNTSGGPSTLAEIGVVTNRDGTLTLDNALLTKQLTAYPDAVEAMFNPTQHASSPLIKITSAMGATKPGTYQLTNIVAQTSEHSASGTIAGVAGVTTGGSLYASVTSGASGLVIQPSGDIASATITVDLGLGGALQAIRDSLRASGGVLDALSTQLTTEKTDLTDQKTKIADDSANYRDRLTTQFAAMNTRVAAYKATQSYLEQQVAVWTKSTA